MASQTIHSPITIIEGKADGVKWQPRNLKGRLERWQKESCEEKAQQATERRAVLRQELMERVAAHHERVRAVRRHEASRSPARHASVVSRQKLAEARRTLLQQEKRRKIADHHKKVASAVSSTRALPKVSERRLTLRHRKAEERRETLLNEQVLHSKQHSDRVTTAQERRRVKGEKLRTRARQVIHCYKLDSEAIEDATFDEVQRVLTSRATVNRAKDLLELISANFEKVIASEKQVVTDDTPVGPFRTTALGKIPSNPRAFLSAYVCKGGMTEQPWTGPAVEVDPLEKAVQAHAGALIEALHSLLAGLEEDSNLNEQETKEVMKRFAREWVSYEASFRSWQKKDRKELLDHYIETYSEVERGRVDIISQTAAQGSRKPEAHQELMGAIDNTLERIRKQIETLGGDKGTEELGRRLQELYDTHQITPTVRPQPTPTTSDAENSAGMRTPEKQQQHKDPEHPQEQQPKHADPYRPLQTMLLKAKLAHDEVFKVSAVPQPEPDEPRVTVQRIKEAAGRAFWDILGEELSCCPPMTDRLNGALQGLKEQLLEVTPRKMRAALEEELEDCVDWELLKHALNYETLAGLVKYFMGKVMELEAPAENDATKAATDEVLRVVEAGGEPGEVVPQALRFVTDRLSKLSDDIHAARKTLIAPLLARDAEQLVRQLHAEEVSRGVHEFEATRRWLRDTLFATLPISPAAKPDASFQPPPLTEGDVAGKANRLYTTVPQLAVLRAVFHPRTVEAPSVFPEALRLHRDLVRRHADAVQVLTLTAAAAGVAAQVSGVPAVSERVCGSLPGLLRSPGVRMPNVVSHVLEAASPLPEPKKKLLAGMLERLGSGVSDKVFETYHGRLLATVKRVIFGEADGEATPFSAPLKGEVASLSAALTKLCSVNLQWYRSFYDPLITGIADELRAEQEEALQTGEL